MLETAKRFPGQELSKDSLNAAIEDWLTLAEEVGLSRFEEGVRRTWQYREFFPKPKNIREFIPPPKMRDGEKWNRELRDLKQRQDAGEKFYTLADVFKEFCNQVESGKVKGRDERGQKALQEWAKKFRGSEEEYARQWLQTSNPNRPKSDFKSAHETLLEQKGQLLGSSANKRRD